MYLNELLDVSNLQKMIDTGYIAKKESGDGRVLYNYTHKAQFDREWNHETRTCRGLVVHDDGCVLGRPFPKFFNLGEPGAPDEQFLAEDKKLVVTDKLDGSLIVAYPYNERTCLNTRGSFFSDQALAAQEWYHEHALDLSIPYGETWLFEWIAPDNRIVVNYGKRRELVFLTHIDNETGRDIDEDPPGWMGTRAEQFAFTDLKKLLAYDRPDAEGYVLRTEAGYRVKVKFSEYVRLHKLLTGVTTKTIWELLSQGGPDALDPLLEVVPDEFYQWVQDTAHDLYQQWFVVEQAAIEDYQKIKHLSANRKEFAEAALKSSHRGLLFAMLDGKDYSPMIWRSIKPVTTKPFTQDDDA